MLAKNAKFVRIKTGAPMFCVRKRVLACFGSLRRLTALEGSMRPLTNSCAAFVSDGLMATCLAAQDAQRKGARQDMKTRNDHRP